MRRIDWPENAFHSARLEQALAGRRAAARQRAEPALAHVLRRSSPASPTDLGVELVVTLGSLLADVPHTRPAPVTASASDPSLVERLGVQPSRYEGPTGIVGVLHDACRAAGIPSVSLWAAVPHYVSMTPSPPRREGALRPARDAARRPARHERAARTRARSTWSR